MITVKDIAQRLGVSPSTVTRALADNPRISEKTRKRVRRTAIEMGYVSNAAAKTMRNQATSLIGLLIPDIENHFYARIAKAFSKICNRHGFQLILAVCDDDPQIEEHHIRRLMEARCAGIAVVPTAELTRQSATLLSATNMAQLIRRHAALHADWYGIDDVTALCSATGSLIDLNHRRIGLICGDEDLNSGRERFLGYANAFDQRNLPLDSSLVMRGPPRAEFSRTATDKLKSLSNPPSAIIAAGAALSEGMLTAVSAWSKDEQRDISLIGYSESPAFRWWGDSGLTAIELPVDRIAADLCLGLVQRVMAGGGTTDEPVDHVYESQLVLRGSTGPAA